MNINSGIIDQRLSAICEEIRKEAQDQLNISDDQRLKSLAFVYLCVKTMLDLTNDEAFDCLTEGGGDFGVDAIHISEERDGEFAISLFQTKYKNNLSGDSNFPESGIKNLINAIRHLFDPGAVLQNINNRLKAKVEEARSLIRDGHIPHVRAIAGNNGLGWNKASQEEINLSGFGHQVTWEHVNHDKLVNMLQAAKPVNDTLQLSGKAIVEDFNFSRVLVGKISVTEIQTLIRRHGERLLERNIRRYLGLCGNRVNVAIRQTLNSNECGNFYFYNNGITLTCEKFSYNALQSGNYQVKVQDMQIINGGQTCMTIYKTLEEPNLFPDLYKDAHVLVRLYQLPSENDDLVRRITFATNSQNPVDLRDLRANDARQQRLETDIGQLGFAYRRKRADTSTKPMDITSGTAAEAILAVWRKRPHQAKFFRREHFGKLYDVIFSETLNGAQTIIAVLLYRIAENRRRKPSSGDPDFVRYASCFIAMQMGSCLLQDLKCTVKELSHRNFQTAKQLVEVKSENYFSQAIQDVTHALRSLYGDTDVSMQQLSATFRRGDLIARLLAGSRASLNDRR